MKTPFYNPRPHFGWFLGTAMTLFPVAASAVSLTHIWNVPEFLPASFTEPVTQDPVEPDDVIDISIIQPNFPTDRSLVSGSARSFYRDQDEETWRPQFGSQVEIRVIDWLDQERKLTALGGTTRAFKLDQDDPDAKVGFRISNTRMQAVSDATAEVFFNMIVRELPNDNQLGEETQLRYKVSIDGKDDTITYDQVGSDILLPEPDLEINFSQLNWDLGIVEGSFALADIDVTDKDHRFEVTYNWEVGINADTSHGTTFARFHDPVGLDGGIELDFTGFIPIPLDTAPAIAAVPLPTPLWALLAGIASLASFGRKSRNSRLGKAR